MSAFETTTNDWHIALLQIFECLYRKDCIQAKNQNSRAKDLDSCYSRVIQEFLEDLHIRRLKVPASLRKKSKQIGSVTDLHYIQNRMLEAIDKINAEVFTEPPKQLAGDI